jgi:hypothetical protein
MKLSRNLVDFLLDVDVVSKPDDSDDDYDYKEFSYDTNEYILKFFLKTKRTFQAESLYSEIGNVLIHLGHPVDKEIIESLIMLFSLSGKEKRNDDLVNNFFSSIEKCKLKQFMFFNGVQKEKIYTLKFNDFSIGAIDYYKFANFVNERSGSDYADKYKSSLSNSAGIEIKSYEIKIIDIYKWGFEINNNLDMSWSQKEIINSYLSSVSMYFINDFKKKFFKQQEFINAYFGLYYPIEQFELHGCTFVNIFYNFLNNFKAGWVLPIGKSIKDIFFPDPRIIEKVNQFLLKNNNKIFKSDSEFSRYLDTVCNIFSNGQKYIFEKDNNHAFVDFFVGLDFLLAPDTEKSKKLKQRISMLSYTAMSLSFQEQLSRLDALYDLRSLYVHQGISIKEDELIELRNICRVVLSVLLQVHTNSLKSNKLKFIDWLAQIDKFVQDIYKGNAPNLQRLAEIGVKKQDHLILQNSLDKWIF